MPRWWSTRASPMDSKGSCASASIASRVETRPRRTPVRSLRSCAGSTVRVDGLGSALESLQITKEQRLHLGRRAGVIHLAAERGVVVEAAHVPGHVLAHEGRGVVALLLGQVVKVSDRGRDPLARRGAGARILAAQQAVGALEEPG